MQTKSTQASNVLEHLQNGKRITPIDALNLYGCFRLSAIIFDLRQQGFPIKTHFKTTNNKTFAEYELTNGEPEVA
tara:strand:- start:1007 stop:1231 length:225 start_codon:yes stop_codon:yes gene_type:complete